MTKVVHNPSGYHSSGRSAGEKARNFADHIKPHGWTGKWSTDNETGILHLFARRGEDETIDIWWTHGGKAHPDMKPVFTVAGDRINLLNVSAAAAMAVKDPNENRMRKARAKRSRKIESRNNNGHVTAEDIATLQCSLPFDHESTDEEILDALYGLEITWVNRISGEMDTAIVGGSRSKHCKIVRNGHDYINFVYQIPQRVLANFGKAQMESDTYGFRSVYLDSIVKVG